MLKSKDDENVDDVDKVVDDDSLCYINCLKLKKTEHKIYIKLNFITN